MSIQFKIIRDNQDFYCAPSTGAKFFVGRRVPFEHNVGLYNIFGKSPIAKLSYEAANYDGDFGFWAAFVDPTAECEGRSFLTLNTYDRARFTFGFTQFAAHVPDGDFVRYFRALLALPEAVDYFPSLHLDHGRIWRDDGGVRVQLEDGHSSAPLMAYLNPTLAEVEDPEVIAAARFIHWTVNSRAARLAQIRETIDRFRGFMATADRRKLIDGRTADQCCIIADILHHGRGGTIAWQLIGDALASPKPFDSLIEIGAPKWNGRKATLRKAILARPVLKAHSWNSAKGDFV